MHYNNSLTLHGIRHIGCAPAPTVVGWVPTVGATTPGAATPTQKASFQVRPGEYYSQFPWMYDYQYFYGQPQFPNVYANPLTSVSPAVTNPYVVQPPVANIQFAKTMR